MSYLDERKRINPASLGVVVGVHVAIGYALISGLAYKVVHLGPQITRAELLPDDPVPPPKMLPPAARPTPTNMPKTIEPVVQVQLPRLDDIQIARTTASDISLKTTDEPQKPQMKAVDSLSRVALPLGDKNGWVTTEDYPSAALRDNIEGTVAIDIAIDTKGHVSGCSVIASSGSDLLDQTTCRVYARHARFRAALGEDGQPISTHRTDRIRWQIPR